MRHDFIWLCCCCWFFFFSSTFLILRPMITRTARGVESNVFMKAVEGGRARHAAASPRTVSHAHAIDAPPSISRLPQPPPSHTPRRPVDGRGRRTGFFFKFSRKKKEKKLYIHSVRIQGGVGVLLPRGSRSHIT